MNLELAKTVADAVLYEGYLLYPYRSTSSKNQVRWQFGVLGPPGSSEAGFGEASALHAECLVRPGPDARVTVLLRFLQLQARGVERADPADPDGFTAVSHLRVGDADLLAWDEAVEGSVELGPYELSDLAAGLDTTAEVAGGREVEPAIAPDGRVAGRVVRRRWPLVAAFHLEAVELPADGAVRLVVQVDNAHPSRAADRDEATRVSFLGAHLLLQAGNAEFVSLLEPPDGLAAAAAACRNERCWPVLTGVEGDTDLVLASPIILYDYPAVAPESAGSLFDSTEIDEILTLRVMTLTDEEKAAARATDPAAAAIIDRCEAMSPEDIQQLHGVLRDPRAIPSDGLAAAGLRSDGFAGGGFPDGLDIPTLTTPGEEPVAPGPEAPWWDPGVDASVSPTSDVVVIDGVAVGKGSQVRLHPRRQADAQDLFFAGQTAKVSAVYFDVDGSAHLAVVLVDDPAADLHEWYGRYLYFAPDEVEPLASPTHRPR